MWGAAPEHGLIDAYTGWFTPNVLAAARKEVDAAAAHRTLQQNFTPQPPSLPVQALTRMTGSLSWKKTRRVFTCMRAKTPC